MRCAFWPAPHEPEDCPGGRILHGSGPPGREVERVDRSSALPRAQAGSSEEQRAESQEQGSDPAMTQRGTIQEEGQVVQLSGTGLSGPSADGELDLIESRLEGRGPVQFNPPPGLTPGSPPISLLDRRRQDPYLVRRTDPAEDLIRSMYAAVQLAERQGIETIEVDRLDQEALLLHEAALMRVIEWASRFGPECSCEGRYVCSWHVGLADAMTAEETA